MNYNESKKAYREAADRFLRGLAEAAQVFKANGLDIPVEVLMRLDDGEVRFLWSPTVARFSFERGDTIVPLEVIAAVPSSSVRAVTVEAIRELYVIGARARDEATIGLSEAASNLSSWVEDMTR